MLRLSQFVPATMRETPSGILVPAVALLVRAGMVRHLGMGSWGFLPLGQRTLRRIMAGLEDCLARAGGVQVAAGGTGLAELLRHDLKSYRSLPCVVWQWRDAVRDAPRPGLGLLGARQFLKMEVLVLARDAAELDGAVAAVETRLIDWLGELQVPPVRIESAGKGGLAVRAWGRESPSGESEWVQCAECGQTAFPVAARTSTTLPPPVPPSSGAPSPVPAPAGSPSLAEMLPLQRVYTPGANTMARLVEVLGVPLTQTVKTMIFSLQREGPSALALALVRGDRDVDELRVCQVLGAEVRPAEEAEIVRLTGAGVGFSGPVGLKRPATIVADPEVAAARNLVVGANLEDYHLVNANPGRDFRVDVVAPVRKVRPGDPCGICQTPLRPVRGIVFGEMARTGDRLPGEWGIKVQMPEGNAAPPHGLTAFLDVYRLLVALVEATADGGGLCWPPAVAPFACLIVTVGPHDEVQLETARRLADHLGKAGVSVVWDDRAQGLGARLKDAELMGFPVRVVIGPRSLAEGRAEVGIRKTGETRVVSLEAVPATVTGILGTDRAAPGAG